MPLDKALEVSTAEGPWNKRYESDMKQTVHYPRLFLGLLGVWPMFSRDSSPTKKYISAFLIVLFLILLTFIIIPPMLHIILIEKDTSRRLIMFGPISFHVTNFFKYSFFLLHFKTVRLCVEHVETDWKSIVCEGDRAIMMNNARIGRSLTLICCVFKTIRPCVEHVKTDWKSIVSERDRAIMRSNAEVGRRLTLISCIFTWTTGISIHTILPIASGNTINEMNETVRPLAFPGYDIFFDCQLQPTNEIVCFTICLSAIVSYNVTSASCSFTAVFVCHACGLLQIVSSRLETLLNSIENKENYDIVKKTAIPYCAISQQSIEEWRSNDAAGIATYCVSLITNVFNILMFCYIGELLKEKGHRVGQAACMIEWYQLPCKSSQDLIMIITMSNNSPPKIMAGRIFELSIRSFGSIIRMSVTYCNVLRTLTV